MIPEVMRVLDLLTSALRDAVIIRIRVLLLLSVEAGSIDVQKTCGVEGTTNDGGRRAMR